MIRWDRNHFYFFSFFYCLKKVIALDLNIFDFNCHAFFSFSLSTLKLMIFINFFSTFMLNRNYFVSHCFHCCEPSLYDWCSFDFYFCFTRIMLHWTTKDNMKQSIREKKNRLKEAQKRVKKKVFDESMEQGGWASHPYVFLLKKKKKKKENMTFHIL